MLDLLPRFERHLRIIQALSASSVAAYAAKVKEFAAWRAGNALDASPSAVTRSDIEAYLEWCFERGNGNNTRTTKLIALQKFFRWAVYEGIIDRDPAADIPRPRLTKRFVQKFTRDEILALFRALDLSRPIDARNAAIIILGAFCGLRSSELINLRMADVVDDGKDIDINIVESKRKDSRVVYLWRSPASVIRQVYFARLGQSARPDDPFLVSYRHGGRVAVGNALTHAALDHMLKASAAKSGIRKPRVRLHMLRATHASDLRNIRGYDIAAICDRMGWRHLSSAEHYFPSRGRIHRVYNSLHEYWFEFTKIWKEIKNDAGGLRDEQ